MPQKSRKAKKKDGGKRKQTNEPEKKEKPKYSTKWSSPDPNPRNSESLTAHFTNDDLQVLKNILKCKDSTIVPLILAAVVLNKLDTLKILVHKGCNLNETGPNHLTALLWAVKCKKVETIDYLLANGADPTVKNDNGDSILFLALENKLWDERAYIALWNNIKNVSFVDVDFMNRNGRNMVHSAIKREWCEMLEILILGKANVNIENSNGMTPLMLASCLNNFKMVSALVKANADILKEDACNGCTALCHAIAYVVNKNLHKPHPVVDKLITALRAHEYTFNDFLKKRIDAVLSDVARQNRAGQPLFDIRASIVPYALRFMENAAKALLDISIFGKISQGVYKNIQEALQIIKYLTMTNEILRFCKQKYGTMEQQLLRSFIGGHGADACLLILKMYGSDSPFDFNFVFAAITPIITVCSTEKEGKMWLQNNCSNIVGFHSKFLLLRPLEQSEALYTPSFEDLSKFNELMSKIKKDKSLSDEVIDDKEPEREYHERNKDRISGKECKPEQKANPKKTKRRAKALKAKLAKIKSADLAERLNQNGKKMLEQKCASDTSIVKRAKKLEASDPRAAQWPQHSAWEQIWLLDNGNIPAVLEFHAAVALLEDQLKTGAGNDVFNVDFEIKSDLDPKASNTEIVSLYPDWKNKSLHVLDGSERNGPTEEFTEQELKCAKKFAEDSESTSASRRDEMRKMFDCSLEYLTGLLRRIIRTYQDLWDRDKEIHDEMENSQTPPVQSTMEKLEIRHVEHVQHKFDKLVAYIKANAYDHFLECSKIIDRLETVLLTHRIRGKSMLQDTHIQIKHFPEDFSACFGNKEELFSCKSHHSDLDYECVIEYPQIAKEHPDALYLEEILALPPKEPPNSEKIRRDKIKTMKNAYHLIPSIIAMCEERDDLICCCRKEIATPTREEVKLEKSSTTIVSKNRKRQTLQETLLAIPKIDDSNKLLEALEKSQTIEFQAPPDSAPSRWCSIIRSFQLLKDYQVLLNGDIRISSSDKDDSHTISTGGNFSPVVLGLDLCDRPLAVKRIHKDNSVCKIMKNLLNPLLGLRNTNLLHYFSCNYEDNDLVLATPLCEYNMGEYVMMMKQWPNMYTKCIDVVKQFLAGLRFLHDRPEPIVHGNLKPSNIFIDLNGTVRIAEFGMYKALYTLIDAPNTSVIWFSRETFTTFRESSSIICTCASDIQVAGMLIHFMLTAGKHPYGETMQEILKNLERSLPQLITNDVDLHDLISWMLLYDPSERPAINQVLSHVFFWNIDRKWRFILACAGVSPHGTSLNIPLKELHLYINIVAARETIKGRWIGVTKRRFPNLPYSKDDQDSITGLLRFIRTCVHNQITFHLNTDYEFRNFILSSFPALPLSLYRILESSQWLNHRVLQPFTTVDSLSV